MVTRHCEPTALAAGNSGSTSSTSRPAANAVGSVAFALAVCLAPLFARAANETPPRPNIVVILCDDLGYADVGFNDGTDVKTPSLDQLAKNGTIFTSAYVCHPFCGPSRMGLMSGRYPHAIGAPFNLPPSGLGIGDFNRQGIDVNEKLISTVLQESGYSTGAFGKWHLGIEQPFHPNNRGFGDFYGFLGGGHMYFPERYGPIYERQVKTGKTSFNEYIVPLEHNGKPVKETEYMTDALSREAVRFVNEAAAKHEPFFLYLAYNAPHTPLEAKDHDLALFADIKDEKRRTYAAMIYAVDRGVGRLVEALKETDSFDNTLIVFLSDNGGKIGGGSNNAPLTEGKGSICEGGYRVPMFFHWPGKVAVGKRFDHPVTALDFYPTFARLAGASVPQAKQLDGKDIWDALTAGRSPRPDESIFALRHWNGFHNVGIRRNQWKASKRGPNSQWMLFNLDDDIGETSDVSGQHPEIVEQLVADGREWSSTHTRPLWFDNKAAEQRWNDQNMPRYDETFLAEAASSQVAAQKPTNSGRKKSESPKPFGGVVDVASGGWNFLETHSDDFRGNQIDLSKWNVDSKDFGVWSWEPENVSQSQGSLHLQMVQQDHQRGGKDYHFTSGMARNDRTLTYGYFEARIKGCSRYPGACPSFWLYSTGPDHRFAATDGETVTYSEIDIVELQQCEFDFKTKKHFPVTRMDCNLHAYVLRDGQRVRVSPPQRPDLCENHFEAPWDPREDYHVYAVLNSKEWVVWYIDGKEIARKRNLYWHLPMHLTLSLGLRYPFVRYRGGERFPVAEETTTEGFPTSMAVDYVRVWQRAEDADSEVRTVNTPSVSAKKAATDWTKGEYIAKEKSKWAEKGWRWDLARVQSNFVEVDSNKDGIASAQERQAWFAKKAAVNQQPKKD